MYCGRACILDGVKENHSKLATLDHVIPCSAGGTDGFDNLVLACFRCNQRRGTADFVTYFAFWQSVAGEFCWVTNSRRRYTFVEKRLPNPALAEALERAGFKQNAA